VRVDRQRDRATAGFAAEDESSTRWRRRCHDADRQPGGADGRAAPGAEAQHQSEADAKRR
jgi:hypothetical protein